MTTVAVRDGFPVTPAPQGVLRFRRDAEGRFVNLDGSGPHGIAAVYKWAVRDKLAGRRRKSPPTAPVPALDVDRAAIQVPPAPGEPPRIVWLGHASWLVQLAGVSLLLDPVLGDSIVGFTKRNGRAPLPASALPRIDAQLVSHNHYDHMDMSSLRAVGAPVVTGMENGRHFAGRLPVTELGWWDAADVSGVRVTYVPSQHWSRRSLADSNRSLWGGFVIEGGGFSIYHSGDTAYFDGFADIGRRFPGLDAALLPIGAYDPQWFMSKQHMNPREALDAFRDLGARRIVAMHWGTFKLTDEPLDEPPRLFRDDAAARGLAEGVARIAAVGEVISLG
ncbi:MAG TPA: MBL fold metallo-hydrolase [Polyangia bacterium]|jgi:L-ascorbate metabolism protein UlaG (beta-lactamase superfamily)|nr:MBL fold metallo-hydrolase [Polyangia bacterium]